LFAAYDMAFPDVIPLKSNTPAVGKLLLFLEKIATLRSVGDKKSVFAAIAKLKAVVLGHRFFSLSRHLQFLLIIIL
jgi:hypothetical protein